MNRIITFENTEIPINEFKVSNPTAFLKQFELFLNSNWKKYKSIFKEDFSEFQPFLDFKQGKVRTKKHLGVIRFKSYEIYIFPKIAKKDEDSINIELYKKHQALWFKYIFYRKDPFLSYESIYKENDGYIEILLKLFIKLSQILLNKTPYYQYKELNETHQGIKGRINFKNYIQKYVSRGNSHQIPQTYEAYEFNNPLNQLIKFIHKKIKGGYSKNLEDFKTNIENNLRILSEVDDKFFKANEVNLLKVTKKDNLIDELIKLSRIIIANIGFDNKNQNDFSYSFLFKSDKLFENFIAQFIKSHYHKINIGKVKLSHNKNFTGSMYVDNEFKGPAKFLKEDIIIEKFNEKIILDTKYKIVDFNNFEDDINQSDINQILHYAKLNQAKKVSLVYPYSFLEDFQNEKIEIKTSDNIVIRFLKVPFFSIKIKEIEPELKKIFDEYLLDIN